MVLLIWSSFSKMEQPYRRFISMQAEVKSYSRYWPNTFTLISKRRRKHPLIDRTNVGCIFQIDTRHTLVHRQGWFTRRKFFADDQCFWSVESIRRFKWHSQAIGKNRANASQRFIAILRLERTWCSSHSRWTFFQNDSFPQRRIPRSKWVDSGQR